MILVSDIPAGDGNVGKLFLQCASEGGTKGRGTGEGDNGKGGV
jgi:hypothetical protein